MQSTTAWQDRYFGMGSMVRDMLVGYDCPLEAVYLPATTHTVMGTMTRERAICIFEQDTGRPLTRHAGFMEGEFGAVKGYVLTIRSISTVGKCVFCLLLPALQLADLDLVMIIVRLFVQCHTYSSFLIGGPLMTSSGT